MSSADDATAVGDDSRQVLYLVSHAHSPPLNPAPDLKYDLRRIPNPPKDIRKSHTGLSKRLREHLLAEPAFVQLLDEAEKEIINAMNGAATTSDETPSLIVGACCFRGHHRSVGFVEQLARRPWPKEWSVVVQHRELDEERPKKRKSKRVDKRSARGDDFHSMD